MTSLIHSSPSLPTDLTTLHTTHFLPIDLTSFIHLFPIYRLDHSACGCVDEAAQETGVSLHLLVGDLMMW